MFKKVARNGKENKRQRSGRIKEKVKYRLVILHDKKKISG